MDRVLKSSVAPVYQIDRSQSYNQKVGEEIKIENRDEKNIFTLVSSQKKYTFSPYKVTDVD